MNRPMMGAPYGYQGPPMMGAPPQGSYQQMPGFQPPMLKPNQPMMQQPSQNAQFYQPPPMQNPIIYQGPQPLPPQQIILTRPNPAKEKYAWQPRTEPMKWQLAESIDVDQIVRKGDLNSVEFYMEQFVYANLTKDDYKQFGSKGALNAFLILQLGCDYLMAQRNQAPPPSTNEADQRLVEQYEKNINEAKKAILEHKKMIEKLQQQVKQLHSDRETQDKVIKQYKTKLAKMKQKMKSSSHRPHGKTETKTLADTEPGALHDETALKALQKADMKRKKLDTGELSDGELSDSGDTPFTDTNTSAISYDEESGYSSDDEGSISDDSGDQYDSDESI